MLTKDDPFIAVDIDYCIEEGQIPDNIQSFISSFDSYTEISPSKKGIRIMVKGTMPEGLGNRFQISGCKGVELYQHSRYVTITGQPLLGKTASIRTLKGED